MKPNAGFWIWFTLCSLLVACRSERPQTINFGDLVRQPDQYQGQFVCTTGIHLTGFEASSLGAGTYELDGFIYLTEPIIWLEEAEVENLGKCTQFQGYSFCSATVCGKFESAGGYGHLGGYEYQISRAE